MANSLAKSDFKGTIYIGYRGILPPWLGQLKNTESGEYYLTGNIVMQFEVIETNLHLAYYKPYFIRKAFTKFSQANKFFYFDVDIVVNAAWTFFSYWLDNGVCLCLDSSFDFVHPNHPWRKDWKRLADIDIAQFNPISDYINSGFIGVARENIGIIDTWITLTEKYDEKGGNLKVINQDGHSSFKGDQDLLNAVITISPEVKLNLIGKEGMGFTQPSYLMTHVINKVKPWRKNFVYHLIRYGHKPSHPEKNFFNHCKYPITLFPKSKMIIKKTNLVIATVLGRYIGY